MTRWLFLHGFLGSPAVFEPLVPAARQLQSSFVAPPLAGHGRPAAPVPHAFDGEVERLATVLAEVGPCNLLGYSLGARLALGIALAHPRLVQRLVLIGVHPGLEDDAERRARAENDDALADHLEQVGLPAFVETWEEAPLFASQRELPEAYRIRHRAIRTGHDAASVAAALRALSLGRMPSFWSRLVALEIPTRFVVGALDGKFVGLAARAHASVPGSSLLQVDAVGHDVLLEAPDALGRVIA